MELEELGKIGLTEGEIKVYGALLELGETTRTELAKKSGISPSKIYDVANRLLEKGIISSVRKNNVIHFSAATPQRLNEFIVRKEHELKKEAEIINKLLPTLLAKYTKTEKSADIEVFYGWEGMKTVFDDITRKLKEGDMNYVLGASRGQNVEQADIFFSQYYRKVERAGYEINVIFNEDMRDYIKRTAYFAKSSIHKVKYLHQETFTEINVYANKVLVILLLSRPIIIRISNPEAANSFRKFFKSMWKEAKK